MPTKYPNGMRLSEGGGRRSAHVTGCSRSRSTMRSVIGAHVPIGAAVVRAAVRITNAIGGAWKR